MKILLMASIFIMFNSYRAISQHWSELSSGIDGPVFAIKQYGDDVIAGGYFGTAGGHYAPFIARWDGISWAPMNGTFAPPSTVRTLAVFGGELIAGGDFGILKWNGSTWSRFPGSGPSGPVHCLFKFNLELYCGGEFTQMNGLPVRNIAKWNGNEWSKLGSGNFFGTGGLVRAMEIYNGNLIVGGTFSSAGGVQTGSVALWNGTQWISIGFDNLNPVFTLYRNMSHPADILYVGGLFNTAGGVAANNIAKWNGAQWSSAGTGTNGAVFTIALYCPPYIIAGGEFTEAGGLSAANIALLNYNSNIWNVLPNGGTNERVWKIENMGGSGLIGGLYAAGEFYTIGGANANRIASKLYYWNYYSMGNRNIPINDFSFADDSTRPFHDYTGEYIISDVNLILDSIIHTNDDDLEITISHNGVTDTVIFRQGGSGDNFTMTVLNDSAATPISSGSAPFTGAYRPEKPLSKFNGLLLDGPWILRIYDRAAGNTGMLNRWSISFQLNEVIGIEQISSSIPAQFMLNQNYPNPFNPATKIKFSIPKASNVVLNVYDILGRHITTLVNEKVNAGTYQTEWNAKNMPSGIYFYRITAGDFTESKKMILVK